MTSARGPQWDALIVGSGATGGAAARVLAHGGMRVLLLEAGDAVTRRQTQSSVARNLSRAVWCKLRGLQSVQSLHPTYWLTNPDFFANDSALPYSSPREAPFHWIRARQEGGRTLTWDAVTPRFSDWELDDGWPLGHADIDPDYSEMERVLGVHGTREGLPQLPDGDFAGESKLTPAEALLQARIEGDFEGRSVIPSRGLRAGRRPEKTEAASRITSTATTLREARASGRLTMRTGVIVARVVTDEAGTRALGVEALDAASHDRSFIPARRVILCASTLESSRILLNSHSAAHPGGLGSSSGWLGRGIMDHCASNIYFTLPGARGVSSSGPLAGADSFMIPRFRTEDVRSRYGGFGVWGGVQRTGVPRVLLRDPDAAFGFVCVRSESEPRRDNHVGIDPELEDAWGVPAVRIECRWSKSDLALARWARSETERMIEAAGGRVGPLSDHIRLLSTGGLIGAMQREWQFSNPGMFAHEVGGARMSARPEDGVVDPHCRLWDVPNLLVTDGACWPTCGWQNPTLHMMALTHRACRELLNGVP